MDRGFTANCVMEAITAHTGVALHAKMQGIDCGAHRMTNRSVLFSVFVAIYLGISGVAEAASPFGEAWSAVKSFFTAEESLLEAPAQAPAPQRRASDAQVAYDDAVRLKNSGAHAEAVARLKEAANAGHAGAAYELGMLYTQGRMVPKNLEQGAQWINRAADLGDARAQYLVGANLMSGNGVARDPARGVGFLARAGEQGHARAQYLLGQAYVDGVGVTANPAWAARWYGRAARAGHADAQYAYGVMYGSGLGVTKNAREAYRWLLRAADNGHTQAGNVARSMARQLPPGEAASLRAESARFAPRAQAQLTDRPTVLFVQYALTSSGFDPGPLDGVMGSRTRAGIRAFEDTIGAQQTGRISAGLLEQLIVRTSKAG